MDFGATLSSGFGEPQKHLETLDASAVFGGLTLKVVFKPASGFGNAWFSVYVNSVLRANYYAEEGQTVTAYLPGTGASCSVEVLRIGHAETYDMSRIVRLDDANTSDRVTLSWEWPVEVFGCIDSDGTTENPDLSAWSFDDLPYTAFAPADQDTRAFATVDLDVDGTDYTVTLSRDGVTLATGSRSGAGEITLAESNDSGVSGSVTVGASPSAASDAILWVRWPRWMRVLRGVSDPPTTVHDTVRFERTAGTWTEPSAVAAGTYYYRLVPVSDTDDVGTESATYSAEIAGPPEPPADLAYASGDASATVLTYTPSATAGATINIYMQGPSDAYMDMSAPDGTDDNDGTATLPAITDYPGTTRVLFRAESAGGVEEETGASLLIEYDEAGARVLPRPNTPYIESVSVDDGLTVTVYGAYPTTGERGTATQLILSAYDMDGTPDWDSPDDTSALGGARRSIKQATLSATLAASGWYKVAVKSKTAAGTLSANASGETVVYVSDDAAAAAENISISVSRG